MKKMYNNPKTEVAVVNTEYMMQDMTMSTAGAGGGGGTTGNEAPKRGDIIE